MPSNLPTDLDICMTTELPVQKQANRPAWLAVLARASQEDLAACLPTLGPLPEVHTIRPPEVGMMMVRGRIGGTGNPFNLGEASVVRCAVRVGEGPLGVSCALGRDKPRAKLAALFDALLQDPQQHDHLQQTLIEPLAQAQQRQRQSRQQQVADSKVEFFTLVRGES